DPLDIGVSTKGLECCWMGGISGDGILIIKIIFKTDPIDIEQL
ncbi:unnamed protein product, partial [Allacma fusca]